MNILEDLYPNIRPKKSPVVRVVLLHLRRRVVILLLGPGHCQWAKLELAPNSNPH